MTTYPPPPLVARPSGILPVECCLRVLRWAGWIHQRTMQMGGYRTYIHIDPAGKVHYLTTYGLRRIAYTNHRKYFEQQLFGNDLTNTPTQGTIHT